MSSINLSIFKSFVQYILQFRLLIKPQKHRCQNQHHCHIQGHDALKEKLLEVVGHVPYHIEDDGGDEGGQDDAEQLPLDHDKHAEILKVHLLHSNPEVI